MVKMILCDDVVCQHCFVDHYSLVAEERSIKHLCCLVCGIPDMSSEAVDIYSYLQKFSALIQTHLSEDQYNMCMQKLAEHSMHKDPNFRWCLWVGISYYSIVFKVYLNNAYQLASVQGSIIVVYTN